MGGVRKRSSDDRLTIGETARRVGATPKALRHYEALGLLPPASRTPNGYRYYRAEDVNRIAFIRRAKALGLTLEEIRGLVTVAEQGLCHLTTAELAQVLARKITDCTDRIEALVAYRDTLVIAARQLTEPNESQVEDSCCPSCAAFAPSCRCLPTPQPLDLDLPR